MQALSALLDLSGIGGDRLWLRWVSSAEGKLFAEYAEQVSRAISELGPFDPEAFRLPLAAVKQVLSTTRVRWLTGMERQLEEVRNVYGTTIDPERYREILAEAVRQEYEKALVLASLTTGEGQLVKQIAEKTGLVVPTVAACLVDLEHEGLAAVDGYDDRDPRLVRVAE